MSSINKKIVVAVALILVASGTAIAEHEVEHNVVYGMYFGTALLMDVYVPEESNGYGLIHISGSGWHAPSGYDAKQLKEFPGVDIYVKPLAEAGYTVFAINHRAAPTFRYPAAIQDAQRAVRYIRYHAENFGIRADWIGAIGGSSGGHLVALLGTLDGDGKDDAIDPIEQESAKVQCVVARAAPVDLVALGDYGMATSFIGMTNMLSFTGAFKDVEDVYHKASPVIHVSPDDPPFLMLHGEKDELIPLRQAHLMTRALEQYDIATRLIVVEGAGHGPGFPGESDAIGTKHWCETRIASESDAQHAAQRLGEHFPTE